MLHSASLPPARLCWLAACHVGVVTAACLVLALEHSAAAYLPPAYGGKVTVPLADVPVTVDPTVASRESELQLCSLLYDNLFVLGSRGKPLPHLADGPIEVSADGRTATIRLRGGVLLHDGRVLTAADVVAALRRARSAPNGYLLAVVASIATSSTDTLVIKLTRAAPELPELLSAPAAAIAIPTSGRFVGSGPFRLAGREQHVWTLEAHASHFAGRPYLDAVIFKRFERSSAEVASFQVGALQISLHGSSMFGGAPRYPTTELETPPLSTIFLGVGTGHGFLAEPQFRAALRAAIDRNRLRRLASAARALVAHGPVAPQLLRYRPRVHGFDRGQARRLLARLAARHPALRSAATGGRVQLTLLLDATRPDDRILAGQLIADLDRVGIAGRIDARPAADYQARLASGKFELALGRVPVQVPSGAAMLAAAMAAAGEREQAQKCIAHSCGPAAARQFIQALPFVPLVHVARRIHHDARIGALRPTISGRIPYARIYWKRAR